VSATISLHVGFDNGPLDTVTTWTNLTSYCHGLTITRGRTNELDGIPPGTLTLRLDNSPEASGARPFDPDDTGSPFTGKLLPGRPVRVIATFLTIDYPLFYGSIDSWGPITYNPAIPYAEVTVTATDNMRLLAELPLRAQRAWTLEDATLGAIDDTTILIQGDAEFAVEEQSGDRISRLLNLAAWPTTIRDIDAGQTALVVHNPDRSERIGSYIEKIRATEYGRVWVTGNGTFRFDQRRAWEQIASQFTSQATFSDNPTGGELVYDHAVYDPGSRTQLRNMVVRQALGGAEFRVANLTSASTYGTREDSFTDMLARDPNEAQDQARYVLSRFGTPTTRVSSITVDSTHAESTHLPQQLGRELFDKITVKRTARSGATSVSRDYWIEQINHQWDRLADQLRTTWLLSEAETTTFWTLEHPTRGAIDSTNLLAY
jgi:hypothetical protein